MFVLVKKRMIIIWLFIILALVVFLINLIFNFIIVKKDYKIISEKISESFKIVHLSDIHGVKTDYKKNQMLKIIKKSEPQIIVLTGDLIDATDYNDKKYPIQKTIRFMKDIVKIAPVYFVFGNHEGALIDDKTDQGFKFVKTIEEAGIRIVNNETDELKIGDTKIAILGLQEPQTVNSYDPFDKTIEEELRFVFQNIDDNAFKILLSHRPEYFNIYSEYNVDLCLTGHAHGGQFRIPFIRGIFAPNQGWFPKYSKGIYEMNGIKMIVSPGLGNSIFKFRIFNPMEIGIISVEK